MKKIMFNDKFGLTDAVLQGRKTVTRRIYTEDIYGESTIEDNPPRIDEVQRGINSKHIKSHLAKYKIGEVIAIAQSYQNIGLGDCGSAAWTNKMFVKSELMPHQIEILNVRVERLQDITEEDSLLEGIEVVSKGMCDVAGAVCWYGIKGTNITREYTPRDAFTKLIDKLSGSGTWEKNPYVFRYEFKLIK
mgnify:CR=1 FL=1|jgi:hypothetical protein|nr:MAG TPA: ASCH domain protein [Caudoviricetes sp.]